MTKKIAFLFPGQGSQYIGMGKDIITKYSPATEIMERAGEIVNIDLVKLCLEGPVERLNDTENTQPALYTISFIIYKMLQERGIIPTMVAGHSLGEYTALAAAGVFSFEDGLTLVRKRGQLMNEALAPGKGTMAAIIGLDQAVILEICQKVDGVCEVANYNSLQQIVISGEIAAINRAVELANDAGAKRAIILDVSGPFHSSLMAKARDKFTVEIEKVNFQRTNTLFIPNVKAELVNDPGKIKDLLIKQLTSSVRWVDTIKLMITQGSEIFVEVGPGKVLKGLMRRIDRSVKAYNIEDLSGLRKFMAEFEIKG